MLDRALDSFGELARLHFELLRAELQADLQQKVQDVLLLAAAVPFFAVAYLLLCVGGCLALGDIIGDKWSFLCIGAAHLVGGAVVVRAGLGRLRKGEAVGTAFIAEATATVRAFKPELDRPRTGVAEVTHVR